jgi:hypothetical protein
LCASFQPSYAALMTTLVGTYHDVAERIREFQKAVVTPLYSAASRAIAIETPLRRSNGSTSSPIR